VGIRSLMITGTLTLCLRPPTTKPPFFGGVEIYLISPPELDFDFTGAANIGDWKVIRGTIYDAIIKCISNAVVVPARVAIDLSEGDEVTHTDLQFPEPIGVLRLVLRSASGLLTGDTNIIGRKSSDPYVTVRVGQQTWKSRTVSKSVNPVWTSGNVADFLVYDMDQAMHFSMYDEDLLTSDDILGEARNVPLTRLGHCRDGADDTTTWQEVRIPLVHQEQGGAGTVAICSRWFHLSASAPVAGISQAAAEGPSQLVVAARMEQLVGMLPKNTQAYFARLKVSCRGWQDMTATTSASKASSTKAASMSQLDRVCVQLAQRRMPIAEIAQVTGMFAESVEVALQSGAAPGTAGETTQHFGQIMRLLLPWTSDMLNHGIVSVDILDGSRIKLGGFQVKLAEVAAQEKRGPFTVWQRVVLEGSLGVTWLS